MSAAPNAIDTRPGQDEPPLVLDLLAKTDRRHHLEHTARDGPDRDVEEER